MKQKKPLSFEILGRHYSLPYDISISPSKERILIAATKLFALQGYAAVSMRDIADGVGMTPGALYNHYRNKESLWEEVIDQAEALYLLYFKQLGEEVEQAESLERMLDLIFMEPRLMRNVYTNYAFALIQTQQFLNSKAGAVFSEVFLGIGSETIKFWFNLAIEKGLARDFDTMTAALIIIQGVMLSINMALQKELGIAAPYDTAAFFDGIKYYILQLGQVETT